MRRRERVLHFAWPEGSVIDGFVGCVRGRGILPTYNSYIYHHDTYATNYVTYQRSPMHHIPGVPMSKKTILLAGSRYAVQPS